jgi:replicative DNA helicase
MALASIASLAGCTDQEIADLLCHHRKLHNSPKASRIDYIQRTIARAREAQPELEAPAQKTNTFASADWGSHVRTRLEESTQEATALPFQRLTDAMDGGLRPGEVCLVAGWTSHGKSIVVDQIADYAAEQGKTVHLYLTEMTAYARGLRLLARHAKIPYSKLKRKELTAVEWGRARDTLDAMPYGCSIVADWAVEDVVAHIRENKWDLAVVDLIHGFHYADERDLSKTSSAIVRAAKGSASDGHPGTAIVCAAHLNDGMMRESRSLKRPRPGLHSLKGSSSLKQDADAVMFVWREDDPEDGWPGLEGHLWIAKSREGGVGAVEVILDPARMEFLERGGENVISIARGAA